MVILSSRLIAAMSWATRCETAAVDVTHGHEVVVLAAAASWPTAPVAGNAISTASAAAPPAAPLRPPPRPPPCPCCRPQPRPPPGARDPPSARPPPVLLLSPQVQPVTRQNVSIFPGIHQSPPIRSDSGRICALQQHVTQQVVTHKQSERNTLSGPFAP